MFIYIDLYDIHICACIDVAKEVDVRAHPALAVVVLVVCLGPNPAAEPLHPRV